LYVASSLNNLGLIYKLQGDFEQAELFYKRSLAILLNNFEETDPKVVVTQKNLITLYRKMNLDAKADILEASIKSTSKVNK
jgi:tetratricopeptide (TPR) repeat protein